MLRCLVMLWLLLACSCVIEQAEQNEAKELAKGLIKDLAKELNEDLARNPTRSPGQDQAKDRAFQASTVQARGADETLDIASWNIEFFGSTGKGPKDEALQLDNARNIIAGTDFDIWGVAEIVDAAHFEALVARLPGYAGLLASDARVAEGARFYASNEQKVGLVFKSSVARVQQARLILTEHAKDFAGRPPLEAELRVSVNGITEKLVVIVLHAKAFDDRASWQRRQKAAAALKGYLDATYPTQQVIVIGDFNDDVDTSITAGQPSSYQGFVTDSQDYDFLTAGLSQAGQTSTVGHDDVIDHHLASNELASRYVRGTAEIYRVDRFIASYGATTSDHFPVLTRYRLGKAAAKSAALAMPGQGQVILNEIRANEPGNSPAGELIEIVNVTKTEIDLSGCTLSDESAVRHVFPAGTGLGPGRALVVFGGSTGIPAQVGNAVVASTGTLGLGNSGDTVTLATSDGTVLDTFTFPAALASSDGVSMNRSPDSKASATFVLHDTLSSSPASPGTRADGNPF